MERPRVLLADGYALLLEAVEKLLEAQCDVVGRVADGRALVETALRLRPDVVVLDISMPSLNGLDAGRRIKQEMPDVKLVFLTVAEDLGLAAEAFRIGASGYLLKSSSASELFQAIREVCAGRRYVTPLVAQSVLDSLQQNGNSRQSFRRLTPRQREVLQLLAEGRSMKQAAAILEVTPRTIAFHKYRIMEQLGLGSNAELIQFAFRQGIVST